MGSCQGRGGWNKSQLPTAEQRSRGRARWKQPPLRASWRGGSPSRSPSAAEPCPHLPRPTARGGSVAFRVFPCRPLPPHPHLNSHAQDLGETLTNSPPALMPLPLFSVLALLSGHPSLVSFPSFPHRSGSGLPHRQDENRNLPQAPGIVLRLKCVICEKIRSMRIAVHHIINYSMQH